MTRQTSLPALFARITSKYSIYLILLAMLVICSLLSDAYAEVKVKTRETGIATRDYAQEHPWTTAGVAVGALGLLAAYLLPLARGEPQEWRGAGFSELDCPFRAARRRLGLATGNHRGFMVRPLAVGFLSSHLMLMETERLAL